MLRTRTRPEQGNAEVAESDVQGNEQAVATPSGARLEVVGLDVVYGDALAVLRNVDLTIASGSIVALLGANGAGKTTLLRAISGLLKINRGRVTQGKVLLDGKEIHDAEPVHIVKAGLAQVMEGRRIFAELTVEENLRSGAYTRRDRAGIEATFDRVLTLFPKLDERRRQVAGYLSGGEQQMVAIGRALMANPRLLVLDEPSLGLAPLIVEQIAEIITQINGEGTSVLLVEQNAHMALGVATHGYVLETGSVVKHGTAEELRNDVDIQEYYLGVSEGGRQSFREIKSYRAGKSWSLR